MIAHISNFVDSIQMEGEQGQVYPSTSPQSARQLDPQFEATKDRADKQLLESEKFEEAIQPPGMAIANLTQRSDNQFFHLTCHIEDALKGKIERGEYVDLEKLIPRDGSRNDQRLKWVHRDGATFLGPVGQKETKISSVKKWDQAFRVYATFYCGANPNRAREIWQYVDVIHTAVNSFAWDNVYNYDVTFRHLMEFNPSRSWAVTYNHMWNISLRDPVTRNGYYSSNSHKGGSHFDIAHSGQLQRQTSNKAKSGKRCKSDYCWNWNRGLHCKYSPKCKFIEHCSYCDSGVHGLNTCPKADAKTKQEGLSGKSGAAGDYSVQSASN